MKTFRYTPLVGLIFWSIGLFCQNAHAEGSFDGFAGRWSGNGNINFTSGATELVRCIATYFPSSNGASLKVNIRCASPGLKIDVKGSLESAGGKLRGSFEERTYNASGSISGTVSQGNIEARIIGQDWSSSLSVKNYGEAVVLTPQGGAVKSVVMHFAKN